MKVKELIEKLRDCNQESEVSTEGCDCHGDCAYVVSDWLDGKVFLARSDGDYFDDNRKLLTKKKGK